MSLLNVTVKRAKYVGAQAAQLNTYVTLKLQNVKSTTVTVKGSEPCWEQDFLFETNSVNSGLLVEVWTKGMIWDRALGYQLIPLDQIPYSTEDSHGQWYPLDMDIILMDGEVAGTKNPTDHMILLDCRFELPFDPETHPGDLQRKLELLNGMMTQDRRHRQAQYLGNSGYSEDSDYTSDLNYPLGQNANSSASQYRNLRTPQRSLETSRENSYEKDDRSSYYDCYPGDNKQNMTSYSPQDYYYKDENDPLSYNSRPMSSINYSKTNYGQTPSMMRKRSLERQDTLYDEYGDNYSNDNMYEDARDRYSFYDTNSDNLSEDRQWDSGGRGTSMNKILPKIPIKHSSSMVDGIYNRGASLPPTPPTSHKKTRLLPQPVSGCTGGGTSIGVGGTLSNSGKSLPATPRMLPQPKSTGKKMPTTPMVKRTENILDDIDSYSSQSQYSSIAINYNEDYNYAYNSTDSLNQTFTDIISRRKGAALPTLPTTTTSTNSTTITRTPKIGVNQNSNYNSLSFEYDKTSITDNDFYGNTTVTDDYFYDSNNTNSTGFNYTSSSSVTTTPVSVRKSKKLPVPVTSAAVSTTSISSAFSTPILSGSRLGSKLPQIPGILGFSGTSLIGTTTITTTTSSSSTVSTGKLLPSKPIQSNYDSFYSQTQLDDYYDEYATSTVPTCNITTFTTNSNKNYDYINYGVTYGSTAYSTAYSTPSTIATTSVTTSTLGGYYKPSGINSTTVGIGEMGPTTTSGGTAKTASSMLDSITTGFKATVGGVVGGVGNVGSNVTSNSSTTGGTSSLTSTAKSYLGLASKFLPNLTGGASSTTTSTTTTATIGTTITSTTSSMKIGGTTVPSSFSISNISSTNKQYGNINDQFNRYDDSEYYYNNYSNSTVEITSNNSTITSSSGLLNDNSCLYSTSGAIITSSMLTSTSTGTSVQDKSNYNNYLNENNLDNYSNNMHYMDQTYSDNNSIYQYNENDLGEYDYLGGINTSIPSTTAAAIIITSTTAATTTSTTSATVPTTRIGNIVDYSDYKYGYDEYSYNENDYIATGDITDKQNYNNNYDIYDITSNSTAADTSTTIVTSTPLTSSLYDYDYSSKYLSKNSIYCDNNSSLAISSTSAASVTVAATCGTVTSGITSSTYSTSIANPSILAQNKTGTYSGSILDQINSITATTPSSTTVASTSNYMTNLQSISLSTSGQNDKTTDVTTPTTSTTTMSSTGKKLPIINGKGGLLMKQQQTEIFEEEEDEMGGSETDQDLIENGHEDDYYMDTHPQTTSGSKTTSTMSTSGYYDKAYTTNDTPYYDYREDYFNEEDEYKYLEKEQEQQQKQQALMQHQKQPPLEFIEESHDDYIDDHVGDHMINSTYPNSSEQQDQQHQQQQNHQQQQQQQQQLQQQQLQQQNSVSKQIEDTKLKHPQLSTQETIDDTSSDYIIDQIQQQQQHQNNLMKQESIIEEEDEEPIPSPTEIYETEPTTAGTVKPQLQSQISSDTMIEEDTKKKTITRGETEEVTSGQMIRKPEVTARQRWHWAYNKIIMQLNVSNF